MTEHPMPTSDDYRAAGFTVEQAGELQRLNLALLEQSLALREQFSELLDRLKPEAWLS